MEHLINPVDRLWNVDSLNAYIYPDDVKLIRGLAVSRSPKKDTIGWSSTEYGKYSVKSGFMVEYYIQIEFKELYILDQV